MTAGTSSERHPAAAAEGPRKSTPGQPWAHAETLALIAAYEEKWYGLRRGQLKAQQWEEVAAAVAARCGGGGPGDSPPKTGTQCRHKIEKLRKRYRAERQRPLASTWPYFGPMDQLERGPLPLSSRPPPHPRARPPPSSSEDDNASEPSEEESDRGGNHTRSISGILRGFPPRVSRNPNLGKRRDFDDEDEEEESDDEGDSEGEGKRGALAGLAAVVRRFAEGFERLEKRRMDMMREVERDRMEMEARREEMVLESQRCLIESITAAFDAAASPPAKKAKKSQD